MGHANFANISRIVNRMLHTKPVTVHEIVDELERTKQTVKASEGELPERYMLSYAVEQILGILYEQDAVEPTSLTRAQKKLFKQWRTEDMSEWDSGNDGKGGEYGLFDTIRWKPLKKKLPVVREFEN